MKNLIMYLIMFLSCTNLLQAQVTFESNGQQLDRISGRGVALGDFNEDGSIDAFVGTGNRYMVYFGDGRGQFTNSNQNLTTSSNYYNSPVVGDINHDGHLDVIAGSSTWLNDGQGSFTAGTTATGNISTVQLADLNKDGHLDIFAIVDYSASRVYFNDGAGNFTDSGQRLGDGTIGTGQIAEIALGDINNDGSIDAITTGWRWNGSTECPNQIWINDGAGNFTLSEQRFEEGNSHVHGSNLYDLNSDGWLDIILGIQDGSRSGRIYLNDKTGNFIRSSNIGSRNGEDVELADFNRDGIIDIFIAQSQQPSRVWLSDGQGNLTDGGARLGSHCYWDTAVGDFNNDKKPDVFAVGFIWGSGGTARMEVWLNTTPLQDPVLADVNFIRGQSIANDSGCGLAFADLDDDNDVDIFVVCGVWNMGKPNKVYFNQGDGSFVDSGQSMGNLNSFDVALADLDEDGDIDAFVANGAYSGGNPNKVWLNDGTGYFTDSRQFMGRNNTGSVALADLDGDGDLDAFACNHPIWQNNRNVGGGHRIWLNNGAGRFTDTGQDLGNAESRSVRLGDIDADGDLDAFVANYRVYGNKFWLNDDAGRFTEAAQVLDTVESREGLLADLDNDGDLDAFVTYFDSQNSSLCPNKIWLNQGDGIFGDSGQRLGRLPTSGLALGDLDSDGDLDAFVINSVWQETRPDEIWLNDGHANFTNSNLDLGDEESVDVALADLDSDGDLDAVVITPEAVKVWLNVREYLAHFTGR
jgi:hypothetical protein